MNLPGSPSFSRTLAVVLIVCALVGTEFSYHLTLESRFDVIEQKLQQNSVALQQFQDSLDSMTSSKTDTLAGLNKQVEALQTSFGPLGKATQNQTDTLSQLHQQIVTMQQAQADELAAQKKLFGSIDQIEKARQEAKKEAAAVPTPVPVAVAPAPTPVVITPPAAAPAPSPAPAPVSAAASPTVPVAAPAAAPTDASAQTHTSVAKPHAVGAASASLRPPPAGNHDLVDLRGDQGDTDLPSPGMMAAHQDDSVSESDSFKSVRALPVGASLSDGR